MENVLVSRGRIRMAWTFVDERDVYYEGQWLKRMSCDSHGHVLSRFYWIPAKHAQWLLALIGEVAPQGIQWDGETGYLEQKDGQTAESKDEYEDLKYHHYPYPKVKI